MAITVHHINSGPSVANAHASVSFTPTANAAILIFASGGFVSGGAGITWSITDNLGTSLTYTSEGNVATSDTYSEAQLWSAKAPASPGAMVITIKLHATNTSEMGFTVWEDTDADPDAPVAQAVMAMRDQVTTSSVATSGNITSGSLSSPASGSDRVCIFGVQVNEDTGTYTTDTPLPAGWYAVDEELGQWNGQVLISSNTQTSATMAWSDNLVVYQDIGSAIIEMSPATDLPYLVGVSTASESSLTENHTINYPTVAGGIEADDFIVLTAGVDQSTNPGNIYPPSGFATLIGVAHGATGQKLYSWFKRADGTETSSDTETWTTSASDSALSQTHMRLYRGVNNGADANSWKVSANLGGTSTAPDPRQVPNVPWYTPDGTRCVAVGVAYYNGVDVDAGPTGYSHLIGDPASNTVTLFTADSAFVGASPNPGPFTISASDDWRVHSIALAPVSAATTIEVGLPTSVNTALAVSVEIEVGLPTSVNTALAVSIAKIIDVGLPTSVHTALEVEGVTTIDVGLPSGAHTALDLKPLNLPIVLSTHWALAVFVEVVIDVGFAYSTHRALALVPDTLEVGIATSTHYALTVEVEAADPPPELATIDDWFNSPHSYSPQFGQKLNDWMNNLVEVIRQGVDDASRQGMLVWSQKYFPGAGSTTSTADPAVQVLGQGLEPIPKFPFPTVMTVTVTGVHQSTAAPGGGYWYIEDGAVLDGASMSGHSSMKDHSRFLILGVANEWQPMIMVGTKILAANEQGEFGVGARASTGTYSWDIAVLVEVRRGELG